MFCEGRLKYWRRYPASTAARARTGLYTRAQATRGSPLLRIDDGLKKTPAGSREAVLADDEFERGTDAEVVAPARSQVAVDGADRVVLELDGQVRHDRVEGVAGRQRHAAPKERQHADDAQETEVHATEHEVVRLLARERHGAAVVAHALDGREHDAGVLEIRRERRFVTVRQRDFRVGRFGQQAVGLPEQQLGPDLVPERLHDDLVEALVAEDALQLPTTLRTAAVVTAGLVPATGEAAG